MVKVGDRVKVLSFGEQPQCVGLLGTVYDIHEPLGPWPIWVELDERTEENGVIHSYPKSCFRESELEVIS